MLGSQLIEPLAFRDGVFEQQIKSVGLWDKAPAHIDYLAAIGHREDGPFERVIAAVSGERFGRLGCHSWNRLQRIDHKNLFKKGLFENSPGQGTGPTIGASLRRFQ